MADRRKLAVLGVVALVLLTGCLHGGSGEDVQSGEDATVAIAVGMSNETQQELQQAQQEARQQVLADLNDSETTMYQQAQQAQILGGELNETQEQLLQRLQQDIQEAQSDAQEKAEQQRQQTLADVENNISESENLELVDRIDVQGQTLILVRGSPNELVGLLSQPGVKAILRQKQYDRIKQQQQQRQQQGGVPGGSPSGDSSE